MKTVCQAIASAVQARLNCIDKQNDIWRLKHAKTIENLIHEYLPHGSGIDNGTTLDYSASDGNKLVFVCGYHHMDEWGGYTVWSHHTIVVTPAFDGFDIRITGRNLNDIKEYLAYTYHYALSQEVELPVIA